MIDIPHLQERRDGRAEVGEVKAGQIDLGSGLEVSDTSLHDGSDLDHDARDSISSAGVARETRCSFNE